MKHHLSTLAVLHYVYGALICLLGLGLLSLVFVGAFLNSDWIAEQSAQPPPYFVGAFVGTLGWVLLFLVELHGILNIISGTRIQQRRGRVFSQVVAALNCINIPIGIALGIYTFVVLGDREVREAYADASWPGAVR